MAAKFHDYASRSAQRGSLESSCEIFSLNYKQKTIATQLELLFLIDEPYGSGRCFLCRSGF